MGIPYIFVRPPFTFWGAKLRKFCFFVQFPEKSDLSMSFIKTYLKIQKMTLDPPHPCQYKKYAQKLPNIK